MVTPEVGRGAKPNPVIEAIHNEGGYRRVRELLSEQYNLGTHEPNIQVWNVDFRGDRTLTLRHFMHERRPLGDTTEAVLRHVAHLWGFAVRLEVVDAKGQVVATRNCRVEKRQPELMPEENEA